jgi:signal transduction histidine kinase
MKNIQDRIVVELCPIDYSQVCTHIITDKQWLQENILCLVSNAVKYSTVGTVTIRAMLTTRIEKTADSDRSAVPPKNTPPKKRSSFGVEYLTEQILRLSAETLSLDDPIQASRKAKYELAEKDTDPQLSPNSDESSKENTRQKSSTVARNFGNKVLPTPCCITSGIEKSMIQSVKTNSSVHATISSTKATYIRFEVVDQGIG